MKYICYRNYNKLSVCNEVLNIDKGVKVNTISNYIAFGPKAICLRTSYDAHYYFALDDDNEGTKRGDLINRIVFFDRHPNKDNDFRFTENEIEMLETEYGRFIKKGLDVILFNQNFYDASIQELQELADRLEV